LIIGGEGTTTPTQEITATYEEEEILIIGGEGTTTPT